MHSPDEPRRQQGTRIGALVGIVALATSHPIVAGATPAPSASAPDAVTEATTHFQVCHLKAEQGDLAAALPECIRAEALLRDAPGHREKHARALKQLIDTRRAIHARSRDVADLCAARDNVDSLLVRLPEAFEVHRADLVAVQTDIRAQCSPPTPPPPPEPVPKPVPKPVPTKTDPTKTDPTRTDPTRTDSTRTGPQTDPPIVVPPPVVTAPWKPLLSTGAVLTALGATALGGMTAGLVLGQQAQDRLAATPRGEREPVFATGQRANHAAIAAGVIGGALAVAGVVLTVIGVKRRAASRAAIGPAPGSVAIGISF